MKWLKCHFIRLHKSVIKKILKWFFRPSSRYGVGIILAVGMILGTLFWSSLNWSMDQSNTMEFCISCHEMHDNVYQEYTKTIHFKNASGVRATCADCHVPKEWLPKLLRKIKATNELYHHFAGTIDTPEKFEANRLTMAERVWASMIESDSQECRNCHSHESMDFHKQRRRSAEKMQAAFKEGEQTCIECHKGIAHSKPMSEDDYDD